MPQSDAATTTLTSNVRLAIFKAGVSRSSVADHLGISRRTFYRRLDDGQFTIADLQVIAAATGTGLLALLPDDARKSA